MSKDKEYFFILCYDNNERVIRMHQSLRRKMTLFLFIYVLCVLVSIVSIYFFGFYLLKLKWICLLFVITLFLSVLIGRYARNQYGKMRYGVKGENTIYKYLSQHLKGYKVYKNVQLVMNGKEFEIDIVVVGEKGICLVEVKNYRGELYGNIDDRDWLQVKKTKDGKIDRIKHKNPIQQLYRQKELLSSYLKKHKMKTTIDGFVFVQCDTVHIQNQQLITQPEKLVEAIQGLDNKKRLNHKDMKTIQKLLKQ